MSALITVLVFRTLTAGLAAAAPGAPDARGHWAFQPLATVEPPGAAAPGVSEVDRFVIAALTREGRQPAPPADRRTLLRRVTFDLTGLPPSPADMEAFLADTSPEAFAEVIDRLLASPAYGEKWGRMWLDVVRYADTAGENTDRPLPHAWRYRNWVIGAFNHDLPYDEFVRWQIAGDLMAADGPPELAADRIVATGGLAIARRFGHDIDKDMHLTFEDTIDTMGKSFLGLTLGCARCHDHKYDPVSVQDYYGLYGIFQSTRFPFTGCEPKPQPKDLVPLVTADMQARLTAWEPRRSAASAALTSARAAMEAERGAFAASVSVPVPVASGTLEPGKAQDLPEAGKPPVLLTVSRGEMLELSVLPRGNYGADSTGVEWVITETGGAKRVWNLAEDYLADPAAGGSGMQHADSHGNPAVWHLMDLVPVPRLFTDFIPDAEKTPGLMVWRGTDPCPSFVINTKAEVAKFITITMPPRSVGVHPGPSGGVAVAWESPIDGEVRITGRLSEIDPGGDGIEWKLERRPSLAAVLVKQKALTQAVSAAEKALREIEAAKPAADLAYAVAEGVVANARIQKKGEPKDPGDEVPRKVLDLFGGTRIPAGTGSGRRELADWLTRGEARTLTARVMVNRIWQGHFGTGIVSTPNDFGTRGAAPSDPALLDWLAARFMADQWSVKAQHRRLLLSAAWQRASQSGSGDAHTAWFPRRRLTAEELRDTLLVLGGNLDPEPGGHHPFPPEATWTFTQHNPFAAEYDHNKRSVYLMVQRTRRHPFLALFDGGDPNASTPVRSESTVPTQALYFLNDPFVHRQAKAMAARLVRAASVDAARMDLAARELYGRPATPDELTLMDGFFAGSTEPDAPEERWAAWLRVLFGTSELLYAD